MTLEDLDKHVKITSVLSEDEITPDNSNMALEDTLQVLNSFYPKLMNTMSIHYMPPTDGRQKTWDVTSDPIYSNPISEGLAIENTYDVNFPSKVVAIDWTLESITKHKSTWLDRIVKDLYVNHYVLIASNKRRQANINDLPFDLRGQDFYSESEEKIKELTQVLINSTPQLL